MRYLCLVALAGLVQSCLGGGLYSTVEAHGPLARIAVDSMATSGGLHYLHAPSAPLAVARSAHAPVATPVTFAAHAVAPVDVVHHVPSVADVPVTKYLTQPGYVQKLVDVPKTRVAVAKLQVKRPAVQKQFFDVEERTIIRPVGSAVVEFEEPVSKKFVTPFTVIPNGYQTVTHFQRPVVYPVSSYPFVSYAPFQTPGQQFYPTFVQQTPQFPFYQPPQQYPTVPQLPQRPPPTPPQAPPQQPPSLPQPSLPSPDDPPSNSEFDSSDTVVVDNPDFTRARASTEQPQRRNEKEESFEDFQKEVTGEETTNFQQEKTIQNILNDFENRQLLREQLTRQSKKLSQQRQNFPIILEPPQSLQQTQENQLKDIQESRDTDSTSQDAASTQTDKSVQSRTGITEEQALAGTDLNSGSKFRSSFDAEEIQNKEQFETEFNEEQFPSDRNLSPEELQDNQQRLIELLTGRGEVSEVALSRAGVRLSPVGDSGVVRTRVVSVTPAPRGQSEGTERVSTRRLVVSRPVHTLEEVDVKQPFTNVERVAVHEPALLRTPHTHIARVSSAVPVLSRSFAPVLYH